MTNPTSPPTSPANAMKLLKTFPVLGLLLAAASLFGGCSSDEGLGNLLAGQACDAFTLHSDPKCVCCSEYGGNCISGESPCAPDDASPSCGNPCPTGLSCVQVNGKAVCGDKNECIGPEEQACGNCGRQTRSCNDGEWSRWSTCQGEKECPAGTVGACSGGTRACSDSCEWQACLECQPQQSETVSCGTCQEQTRTCSKNGKWSELSECTYTGACTPGDTQECTGGEQQCAANCQWGGCQQFECEPGDSEPVACGNCGVQTRTCLDNHTWGALGACEGQGECSAGDFAACGGNSYHECSDTCTWGACNPVTCVPGTSDSEVCGTCGTRNRTCVKGEWSAFGNCTNQGTCEPNDTQACGNQGTQTCNVSCQWSNCTGQVCDGSPVELCGNCGFRSRTCNNGTWSGFGTCTGERECLPGAMQSCGGQQSKTCGLDCYFGACQ